ncbi:hypothetical protein [Vibrio marisflavi]|uniref:Uncharacterized protein n=1 Tax=Vibrio marisflavi CECT 7928 TaxID=634439 RepID=A0ABM9A0G3_9VIBR|nr:hypothetical protein [Vibrio marisflavi]CAH0537015.1 hypothetical protein VMF7928_00864 [Vibrio marisflavi CECT 7928]
MLDPEFGLHKQALFWISVLIPVYLFVFTGLCVWRDYYLTFSEQGFAVFLSISKLPLGLLALSLPLGVLVTRIHSTKQTAEQINQAKTNENNRLEEKKKKRRGLL